MKNKYDECIIVEFSSIEEEEAYIRKQEKCSFQKGKQNINKILKNIKWLLEPEEF